MSLTKRPGPSGPSPFPDNLLELWWVRVPVALRRSSVLLSEVWHDGLYLTAVPLAAVLFPILLFLCGAAEGITHWTFVLGPFSGVDPIAPFTELLPLMIVAAGIGALSANLGLMLVLGYGLGDCLSADFGPPLQTFDSLHAVLLDFYAPRLISYLVFCLLAVTPTLTARYATLFLRRWVPSKPARAIAQTALGAVIVGALVSAWTLATPLLIRVFWGWGWNGINSYTMGIYFLQQPESSTPIVLAAVIAFVGRSVFEYRASQSKPVRQRAARLGRGLKASDAHPGWLRRLPAFVRALVPAAITTFLLGGIITDLRECLILWLFLWLVLVVRGTVLPLLGFWATWARVVSAVPVVVRLALALFVISFPARWLIEGLFDTPNLLVDTPSASFEPFLLTAGVSAVVITLLLPQSRSGQTPAQAQLGGKPA